MAAAQNYIEGRVSAVALVSSGPAITNLATAILVAHDNGWRLRVGRQALRGYA